MPKASFNYTFLRAWINATEIFNFEMNLNLDRQQVRRKYNDMKAKNRIFFLIYMLSKPHIILINSFFL